MSVVYSDQYKSAYENVPKTKNLPGDDHGRLRVKYFSYTTTEALELSDVVKLFKLPTGSRVHEFLLDSPDLGTGGDFDAGWAEGENGEEAADADGFLDGADVNADASIHKMTNTPGLAGQFKRFSEAVDVQLTVAEATTAGGTIVGSCYYTVD